MLSCLLRRFALTKLDILDDQPVIKIGVAYLINGQTIDYYPGMRLHGVARNKTPSKSDKDFRIKFSEFKKE